MELASLMHCPVITVTADTPLPQARALMVRHGIRHLPVVEGGVLVGLLTDLQIRRVEPSTVAALASYEQAALLEHLPVQQVMTQRIVQRTPDTLVHEVAWILWEGQAESILVVERGELLGIVTTSDLIACLIDACERRWPPAYRQIVVPTDFGAAAAHALHTALALAGQHHASLTLLHVLVPLGHTLAGDIEHVPSGMLEQIDDDRKSATAQRLTALLEAHDDVRVTYHVTAGDPVAAIVHTAAQVKADLIVMGSYRRRGLRRFLTKSVAEGVTRYAPCPVLIIKEQGRRRHARL